LAHFVQFLSEDAILCANKMPIRYPETIATVSFLPDAWRVAARPTSMSDSPFWENLSAEEVFGIRRRQEDPPPEVTGAFTSLDLKRTLFAHFEPWPLLEQTEYRRDWRGWPYQRPREMFDAIVWQPGYLGTAWVSTERVAEAIQQLVQDGEFEVIATWTGQQILRRTLPADR
jgi:hypothetical protein